MSLTYNEKCLLSRIWKHEKALKKPYECAFLETAYCKNLVEAGYLKFAGSQTSFSLTPRGWASVKWSKPIVGKIAIDIVVHSGRGLPDPDTSIVPV